MIETGPLCTDASYAERIRAFFALSGATLLQPITRDLGDGIYYVLPGDPPHDFHGDIRHGLKRGFTTEQGAMRAALYAMGVDIASERFTHETEPLHV